MRTTMRILAVAGLLLGGAAGGCFAKDKKVDARDKNGDTALLRAASAGDAESVKALLAAGADVREKDRIGQSAVTRAAFGGHADVVRLLLEAGANREVEKECKKSCNALTGAAEHGYADVVKLLLDAGANKDAATMCNTSFTRILHPADLNPKGMHPGQTFTGSSYSGAITVTMSQPEPGGDIYLVQTGAIPETALTLAAMNDHADVVKLLLDAGANKNGHDELYIGQVTPSRFGLSHYEFFSARETALEAATQGKHQDVVDLLTAAGEKY